MNGAWFVRRGGWYRRQMGAGSPGWRTAWVGGRDGGKSDVQMGDWVWLGAGWSGRRRVGKRVLGLGGGSRGVWGGLSKLILAGSVSRCWFWWRVNSGEVCVGLRSSVLKGVAGTWGGSAFGAEEGVQEWCWLLGRDGGNNSLVEGSSQVCWGTRPDRAGQLEGQGLFFFFFFN